MESLKVGRIEWGKNCQDLEVEFPTNRPKNVRQSSVIYLSHLVKGH